MLQFRQNSEAILRRLRRGERMVLTYRGQPVARLEPVRDALPDPEDPAYRLFEFADADGESLTNREIDDIVYGA
jgi:antitoxin (DNA-binding transcriptional repressor) of toxin-antitoxin stability system